MNPNQQTTSTADEKADSLHDEIYRDNPDDSGEFVAVATNEGEPEPPRDLIMEAIERMHEYSLIPADYDLANQVIEAGRTHPDWALAIKIAVAWENDPEFEYE